MKDHIVLRIYFSYSGPLSMLRLADDSSFDKGVHMINALVEQLISKLDIERLCK